VYFASTRAMFSSNVLSASDRASPPIPICTGPGGLGVHVVAPPEKSGSERHKTDTLRCLVHRSVFDPEQARASLGNFCYSVRTEKCGP
jgi:hypothetical protein